MKQMDLIFSFACAALTSPARTLSKFIPTLILALVAVGAASCHRAGSGAARDSEAATRTFTVRGILHAIDFAGRSVTVEHEEIPGYMPSMTMPFDVKTMNEVEALNAGDAIEFTLAITKKTSWIEGVKRIASSEIHLPGKKRGDVGPATKIVRLKEGDRLPDFQLIDSKSRPITRDTFAGKPLILTFIFTRCPLPNFCPFITNNFREIQQALVEAGPPAGEVQLLSISFDSEFDTPEVLTQYAARYTKESDRWRFATGTAAQVKGLTEAFSVAVQVEGGTFNHGLATALVGADGIIRKIWRGNGWKPAEVVEAVRGL